MDDEYFGDEIPTVQIPPKTTVQFLTVKIPTVKRNTVKNSTDRITTVKIPSARQTYRTLHDCKPRSIIVRTQL